MKAPQEHELGWLGTGTTTWAVSTAPQSPRRSPCSRGGRIDADPFAAIARSAMSAKWTVRLRARIVVSLLEAPARDADRFGFDANTRKIARPRCRVETDSEGRVLSGRSQAARASD